MLAFPSWFVEIASRYLHEENLLAAASGIATASGLGLLLIGYAIL